MRTRLACDLIIPANLAFVDCRLMAPKGIGKAIGRSRYAVSLTDHPKRTEPDQRFIPTSLIQWNPRLSKIGFGSLKARGHSRTPITDYDLIASP
jgi:hypothetical protein